MGGRKSKTQQDPGEYQPENEFNNFYYFSRFTKKLFKIKSKKATRHKLKGKIKVYTDSAISNISNNEIAVIGGSDSLNSLTNTVFFIDCSKNRVLSFEPAPIKSKEGHIIVDGENYYFVGTTIETNENSGAIQGGPVMIYQKNRKQWNIIPHDRISKSNFYSLTENKKELDEIDFNLSSLISPGAFLLNGRIYLLGGKTFDGKNYNPSEKVFSLGTSEWDLRLEPFTLPIKLINPQCISKDKKTYIVGGNLENGKANLEVFIYTTKSNMIVNYHVSFESKIEENYSPQIVSDNIVFFSYPKFWIKSKGSKKFTSYLINDSSGKDYHKVSPTLKESSTPIEVQYIVVKNHSLLNFDFAITNGEYISNPSGYEFPFQKKVVDLASTPFHVDEILSVEIDPILFYDSKSKKKIKFKLNGKTAVLIVYSHKLHESYNIDFDKIIDAKNPETPLNWIIPVNVNKIYYSNWSKTVVTKKVWTAAPKDEDELVSVCNWGADNGYLIRPKGIMHGLSPLTMSNQEKEKVLLIDLTKYPCQPKVNPKSVYGPVVTVSTGTTMGELMTYLEQQEGPGDAPGWSFPHIPAPAHLTVGGVLAIDAHGTGIPCQSEHFNMSYGSLSNHLVELWAVVTDPKIDPHKYVIKKFDRREKDTKALLTHLGRITIFKVTLKVIPNYNLRCQSLTNLDYKTIFAKPIDGTNPENSLAYLVEKSGRVEIICFPFSMYPWTKVWSHAPKLPIGSIKVDHMNNYEFSDSYPDYITSLLKKVESIPDVTPELCSFMGKYPKLQLDLTNKEDLWGPSKNTLIYVKDQTLRVTDNGYAIHMNRSYIQQASYLVGNKFDKMVKDYDSFKKWPINCPLEIRVTGLDKNEHIFKYSDDEFNRPVISALAYSKLDKEKGWDVALWVNILTIPGTKYSNEFYEKFELWLLKTFNDDNAKTYVEWSKGWAYTRKNGPWTSPGVIQAIKAGFSDFRNDDDNWEWEKATLLKYDGRNIFFSELNRLLLS